MNTDFGRNVAGIHAYGGEPHAGISPLRKKGERLWAADSAQPTCSCEGGTRTALYSERTEVSWWLAVEEAGFELRPSGSRAHTPRVLRQLCVGPSSGPYQSGAV